MRDAKRSSFSGLVKYITNAQEKQERVGEVRLTNFQSESLDWAMAEALHIQQQNQRAENDKTYHLLISFAPGEQPSAEVLRDAENRICAAIGFGEHQRVSAVHHDTDNLHIHIAINKIHPVKHTIHEPYRAYQAMGDVCATLEREHGLQVTNHTAKKRGGENRADDMEQHAGIESLLGWVKRECAAQLVGAQSWAELHEVTRKNGLTIQERGNGLVVTDGRGVGVKASSIARTLSKASLEKRLGAFQADPIKSGLRASPAAPRNDRKAPPVIAVGGPPPEMLKGRLSSLSKVQVLKGQSGKRYEGKPIRQGGGEEATELYARFKAEQGVDLHARADAWQAAKKRKIQAIESAKRIGRVKRAAIKVMSTSGLNKKFLYALVSRALHADIKKANAQYISDRQSAYGQYKKQAWADWLQAKAVDGDEAALRALRARKGRKAVAGDCVAGSGLVRRSGRMPLKVDSVTKDGTVIHRFGNSAIRDDGDALQVARGSHAAGLEAVLRMAIHRYGENIAVNGSDNFKEKLARVAAISKLKITFDDPILEARRQELVRSINKENSNDRSTRLKPNVSSRGAVTGGGGGDVSNGRRPINAAGSAGTKRGRTAGGAGVRRGPGHTNKSSAGGIGTRPPAKSRNSLRELSELSVVRVSERSEVLLPSDVSNNVQHKRAELSGGVRRDVSGAGRRLEKSIGRGPGATNRPRVIPVGGRPPAMLRGKLQPISMLRNLQPTGRVDTPDVSLPIISAEKAATAMPKRLSAADKYIAERSQKRAKGFDIPNHRPYTSTDKGAAKFAGVRQIEGENLVLLKRDEEIIVLSVDATTASRFKRYSLGDAVTLDDKGAIRKKGRSR